MNPETIPFWLALILQLGLGLGVFRANSQNRVNQSFLIVCVFISGWLLSLHFVFTAYDPQVAERWIRAASASGILVVNSFNVLRLAILHRNSSWQEIGWRSAGLAIPSLILTALCYTHLFLRFARIQVEAGQQGLAPEAVYGPIGPVYAVFTFSAVTLVIFLSVRRYEQKCRDRKVELQFVMTGGAVLFLLVLLIEYLLEGVLPPLKQRAVSELFAASRVVVFSLIIAYGIATRKIMDVGFFLRRMMGYAVLTAYLLVLYALVWWLIASVFGPILGGRSRALAHVIGALVIAFAMVPARGISQSLANRLFLGTRRLDFQATMNQAAAILRSVTTVPDLLERFGLTIAQAVDTERVFLLLPEQEFYAQRFPAVQTWIADDPDGAASRPGYYCPPRPDTRSNRSGRTPSGSFHAGARTSKTTNEIARCRCRDGNFLPRTTRRCHASGSTPFRTHLRHASSRARFLFFADSSRSRSRTPSFSPRCRTQESTTKRSCKT